MLVRMMAEMILCGRRLFVLAILRHGRIAPLERQHAKYKDGNETTHQRIMPDKIGRIILVKRLCTVDTSKQAQAIGDHDETGTCIGKDRHPKRTVTGERQDKENGFDGQREHDVLPKYLGSFPGQANEFGQLPQVVLHQRHIGRFNRSIRASRTHRKADA